MRVMFTLAAALVAVVTGVTIATASSPGDRPGGKREHVLKVTRDAGTGAVLDLDHSATPGKPAPDSMGDENVFSANFYVGDKRVGFDGGVCKLVRLPAYFQCVATNSFPEGDLCAVPGGLQPERAGAVRDHRRHARIVAPRVR